MYKRVLILNRLIVRTFTYRFDLYTCQQTTHFLIYVLSFPIQIVYQHPYLSDHIQTLVVEKNGEMYI